MPVRAIHHIDLAVRDVQRSLDFYLAVLGPLGVREEMRDPSYRGTEEIVYLRAGEQYLGLRPADGGEHHDVVRHETLAGKNLFLAVSVQVHQADGMWLRPRVIDHVLYPGVVGTLLQPEKAVVMRHGG